MGKDKLDIPLWKKALSYLTEIRLEETSSEYHSILAVNLVKGRHQLCCENAIYSYDDKYDNFRLAFKALQFDKSKWESVLVLGLGLASIPYLLEITMEKALSFTAIEIDDVVASLAQKYTMHRLSSPIDVVIADAYHYLAVDEKKFDIITMDIFADDVIPIKFQTIEYLETLKSKLNPGGVLLYNRLAMTDFDKEASSSFYHKFKQVFPNSDYLEVKDNWMFVNDKSFIVKK